jgi:hypothetical protein
VAFSKIDIWNLALSHLGIKVEVGSEGEDSDEARACRRFYDLCLEEMLREYPWSFARKINALALIREKPNSFWSFEYRYPSDCVYVLRIAVERETNPGVLHDTPYQIAADAAGKVIWTDQDKAAIEYTSLVTNTQLYPADFVHALSYRLASSMALRFMKLDPGIGRLAAELYQRSLEVARASDGNEGFRPSAPSGDLLSSRG